MKRGDKVNELEKALAFIKDKNNSLIEISRKHDIPYQTLRNWRSNPDKLSKSSWERVHLLAALYDKKEKSKMKKIEFWDNEDGTFDVRIVKDQYDWVKCGVLEFDKEQDAWVLWTGISYSDEDSGLSKESDNGETYEESLEETKQEVVDDLNAYFLN